MLVYKNWKSIKITKTEKMRYIYDGWFLFGFIPLYVRRANLDL